MDKMKGMEGCGKNMGAMMDTDKDGKVSKDEFTKHHDDDVRADGHEQGRHARPIRDGPHGQDDGEPLRRHAHEGRHGRGDVRIPLLRAGVWRDERGSDAGASRPLQSGPSRLPAVPEISSRRR